MPYCYATAPPLSEVARGKAQSPRVNCLVAATVKDIVGWLCGIAVERRSLAGKLSSNTIRNNLMVYIIQ